MTIMIAARYYDTVYSRSWSHFSNDSLTKIQLYFAHNLDFVSVHLQFKLNLSHITYNVYVYVSHWRSNLFHITALRLYVYLLTLWQIMDIYIAAIRQCIGLMIITIITWYCTYWIYWPYCKMNFNDKWFGLVVNIRVHLCCIRFLDLFCRFMKVPKSLENVWKM